MPAKKVPAALVTELQRQFNHELAAAHAYTALAVWSFERNLKGFARYFYKQSGEEREHAQKFMDHLLDRGVMPVLAAIPAPKSGFKSIVEVAKHARTMEQANSAGIHRCYEAALKAKDYPAQVLLHWYISEQVEEEAWCEEMVTRTEAIGSPGGLQALDHHIIKLLADQGHDGDED